MNRLYRNESVSLPSWLQWPSAVVCCALYGLCCLPSFRLIGHFALQMSLSVLLSALCTAFFFFLLPRSLTVIGKGLSLFLLSAVAAATVQQIRAQMAAEVFSGWIQTFFYDKLFTVSIIWVVAYFSVLLLRLCLPHTESLRAFRTDYERFFRDSTGVFIAYYIIVLVYCFFLQRKPGSDSGMNLVPFSMIVSYFHAASAAYESYFYLVGNTLCFFPLGFYYRVYRPRYDLPRTILLPIVLSLLIEIIQLVFQMGHFDIDDILMNVFGFYSGYFLSFLTDVIRKKRSGGEETSIFSFLKT